jgi:hypothetical protein
MTADRLEVDGARPGQEEYRLRREIESLQGQALAVIASGKPDSERQERLKKLNADLSAVRAQRRSQVGRGRAILFETARSVAGDGSADRDDDPTMGGDTTGVEVKVEQHMSHVPTGIAHLLDRSTPLVSFEIANRNERIVRLRLSSRVDGYSTEAIDTIEVKGKETETVGQWPVFHSERLRRITELTRASLVVGVDDLDEKRELERSFAIWLLSRATALNGLEDLKTGLWTDLTHYYAAWVTPNAPAIMDLLRAAADLHPDKQLVGYQTDAEGVALQVRAVFDALKAQNLTYIDSRICFGATEGRINQRVRLPREALARRSANCIDGTLLMASLLEAASLNPALVFVPGHAFLAWEKQWQSGEWDYLETTLVGKADFAAAQLAGHLLAEHQATIRESNRDPRQMVRHSLVDLRVSRNIVPME